MQPRSQGSSCVSRKLSRYSSDELFGGERCEIFWRVALNFTPEGRIICRNVNRVKGCDLFYCNFAHVCSHKVNGKACAQSHPRYSHQGGPRSAVSTPSLPAITRNRSHIASRIPHVNQIELKKWPSDVTKKCMGSKTKPFLGG